MKKAFTMAEILLSLTIIGVVAAITLPSLTGNINERTWNTQRKALYARFSQAIPLMDALNGFGTLTEGTESTSAVDTAAETFVTNGLAKVMKINNICDNKHLEDCGIASKITTLGGLPLDMPTTMSELNAEMAGSYEYSGESMSLLDTKTAAFETGNGESIAVYYNPRCIGSLNEDGTLSAHGGNYIAPKICANFVYDLNGNKGPNTVGKDIGFITAMYPTDVKVVAPYPANRYLNTMYALAPNSASEISASKACTNYDSEYRVPNIDELMSMAVNKNLIKGDSYSFTGNFWSSSKINSAYSFFIGYSASQYDGWENENKANVWCIKR